VCDLQKEYTMTQTREKYTRALPFLRVLDKAKSYVNKNDILTKFPVYVTNDIIEILYNICIGKLHVKSSQKKTLAKYRTQIHTFARLPSLKSKRKFLYEQKGGFLRALLPIIISVLDNLFT
jgi:hypothetical protein